MATEVSDSVAKDGEKLLAEEPELIRDAQLGDRAAFAVLVERYWDRLYRWLYHLTHDAHAAEDLAQETFLKAFAAINRFRVGTNFRAWLLRILTNTHINRYRRTKLSPEGRASCRPPLATGVSVSVAPVASEAEVGAV